MTKSHHSATEARRLPIEMESSAIYGLAKLLNHKAITLCIIIGNRVTGKFLNDYQPAVKDLAKKVLESFQFTETI